MAIMPVKDGPCCPGCGLPNYSGLCPHCRGDEDDFQREIDPIHGRDEQTKEGK